jgi:transposase
MYLGRTKQKIFRKTLRDAHSQFDSPADALIENGCGRIAMESTGIYWMPVWHVLESDFSLKLANPYFIKQLPGRKSDVKDAYWIAKYLQKDLIKGSFVPGEVLQQMRQLTRQCHRLIKIEFSLNNRWTTGCSDAIFVEATMFPIKGTRYRRARSLKHYCRGKRTF